jgi:hypothetical protein
MIALLFISLTALYIIVAVAIREISYKFFEMSYGDRLAGIDLLYGIFWPLTILVICGIMIGRKVNKE